MTSHSLSIIITVSYESLTMVKQCLTSLSKLDGKDIHIYLLDQTNNKSIEELIDTMSTHSVVFHYQAIEKKSLSFARNTGITLAKSRFVAFCDIDCELEKNWAAEILHSFHLTKAALVGTKITPRWEHTPSWIHTKKPIQDFYSLFDIATIRTQTGKVIGASFALDKETLGKECFFKENFGRRNGKLLGGEETDLCQRALDKNLTIFFTPYTQAYHHVSSQRMTLRWLCKRIFYGGVSRALRGGKIQPNNTTQTKKEMFAQLLIAPVYLLGYSWGKVSMLQYIPKIIYITSFLYILYSFSITRFPDAISHYIYNNLPFRESYHPTILGIIVIYLLPCMLGFLISGCITNGKNKQPFFYYFNASLFAGLITSLLFFLTPSYNSFMWLERIETAFYLLFIPILCVCGSVPYYILYAQKQEKIVPDKVSQTIFTYVIGLLFALLLFTLNYIPVQQSPYLIGADIYYHAPMTHVITTTFNIFQNAFFKENNNYYYSITYYILGFITGITNIDVGTIWKLYPGIASSLFIFLYFLLIHRLYKNLLLCVITTLCILPYRQILWADPSMRDLSYLVFIIYLFILSSLNPASFTKKKLLITVSSLFLVLITHAEIGIHAILITCFYFLLHKYTFVYKCISLPFREKVKQYASRISLPQSGKSLSFFSRIDVTLLFFICFGLFALHEVTSIVAYVAFGNLTIFNEIPLSILQPIGIISFICFLGIPYSIVTKDFWASDKTRVVLSVSLIFVSALFYFTHIWSLYHRYFTETAYLGLAVSGAYFWMNIITKLNVVKRIMVITMLCIIVAYSILPKYLFITQYIYASDKNIATYSTTFHLISLATSPGAVILAYPGDIINRYIPWYTNRYIFAGSATISKSQQWQVLSFCNGPFAKNCNKRQKLATRFFEHPSLEKLAVMKKMYTVDYLLLQRSDITLLQRLQRSNLYPQLGVAMYTPKYILYTLPSPTK